MKIWNPKVNESDLCGSQFICREIVYKEKIKQNFNFVSVNEKKKWDVEYYELYVERYRKLSHIVRQVIVVVFIVF